MTTAKTWANRIIGHGVEAPDQLLANPRNWRIHPKAQQDALGGLLDRVGWVQDVIVNQRTGHVVDGHLRVSLAISRQEPSMPVVYVDLSLEEEALVLASLDPLAAMAVTDEEMLAELMQDVTAEGALADMLGDLIKHEPKGGLTDPDEIPEAPEPTSKLGDLWLLGEHRLLCGDSTSAEDVARLLDGGVPTLLLTDPPYGVELDMEWRDERGHNEMAPASRSYMKQAMAGKGISGDTIADWLHAFALVASLEVAYVWHASVNLVEVGAGLRSIGFDLRQTIIWNKTVAAMSRSHYHWKHEPCWYAVKKGATASWIGTRDQNTVWDAASPKHIMSGSKEQKFDHPTQKPVALIERSIENHSGQVYEPFSGSGTTLIACERLGRKCYAMEIEPRYVDVAVARWENFTGQKAVLDA